MNSKQAVVFLDEKPTLELMAEETFVKVTLGGHRFWSVMRPYTSNELRDLLESQRPKIQSNEKSSIIVPGNEERSIPFFDQHWIRSYGLQATPGVEAEIERQREWFNRNPNAKKATVRNISTIKIKRDETADLEDVGIVISNLEASETRIEADIPVSYINGNSSTPAETDVHVVFIMRKETQQESLSYHRATDGREISKRSGDMTINTRYAELENLFDGLCEGVEGMVVDGKPCDLSNRAKWIHSIPMWYKYAVVSELFSESRLKN